MMLNSGGDQHTNGVALLARHPFDKAHTSWNPISERLLLARFIHKHGHLTVIVAYTPTEPSGTDDKDLFYNQLSAVTQTISPHDIVTILGDFNAVSGIHDNGCNVVGPFSSGSPNDNSDRLVSYCSMHDLTINGSWFRRLNIHRHTWIITRWR